MSADNVSEMRWINNNDADSDGSDNNDNFNNYNSDNDNNFNNSIQEHNEHEILYSYINNPIPIRVLLGTATEHVEEYIRDDRCRVFLERHRAEIDYENEFYEGAAEIEFIKHHLERLHYELINAHSTIEIYTNYPNSSDPPITENDYNRAVSNLRNIIHILVTELGMRTDVVRKLHLVDKKRDVTRSLNNTNDTMKIAAFGDNYNEMFPEGIRLLQRFCELEFNINERIPCRYTHILLHHTEEFTEEEYNRRLQELMNMQMSIFEFHDEAENMIASRHASRAPVRRTRARRRLNENSENE